MSDEQEKQVEEVLEEKVEEVAEEIQETEVPSEELKEEVKEERPEKNYKAELERKTARLRELEAKLAAENAQPKRRDEKDLTTWADHELKAIINSSDPSVMIYKDAAQDVLLDRKLSAREAKKYESEKKAVSDLKLRTEYPDAVNPDSELALKMEEVMQEYDLQKSPAGRLAAAKIAASELNKGRSSASAKERNAEKARIASVKGQMVDGDRSKSIESLSPKKEAQLKADINAKDLNTSAKAFNELLKSKGLGRADFFKQ